MLMALAAKFTFHPVGGGMFDQWTLFLLRDKGKRKEMLGHSLWEIKNINFFTISL
jgi:hypothetical protein